MERREGERRGREREKARASYDIISILYLAMILICIKAELFTNEMNNMIVVCYTNSLKNILFNSSSDFVMIYVHIYRAYRNDYK